MSAWIASPTRCFRRLATATVSLALCLSAAAGPRSPAVKAEFRRLAPCPATGKTTGACPGYQVDHRLALCAGGPDHATNMQWLSVADHKVKTRSDVGVCRAQKAGVHPK